MHKLAFQKEKIREVLCSMCNKEKNNITGLHRKIYLKSSV